MALDFLGEIVMQVVGEILGYATGRVIIPLLSFGKARGERVSDEQQPGSSRSRWRDGEKIVFSQSVTTTIGFLFWVCVVAVGYVIYECRQV